MATERQVEALGAPVDPQVGPGFVGGEPFDLGLGAQRDAEPEQVADPPAEPPAGLEDGGHVAWILTQQARSAEPRPSGPDDRDVHARLVLGGRTSANA